MNITLNKTDNVNGVIAIEIEKQDYAEKVENELKRFRQKASIPGFRPGKVPAEIIRKMYGKSILADELNKLVSDELFKYIRENNLEILGEPLPNETDQKTIDFDKDETFEFKFDIGFAPEFDLPLSAEDELTYYTVKLEDDLLKQQLEAYKTNYGTYQSVDEPALETDLLKGTLTEFEDGAPKENGLIIENAILMPSYVKDEEIKKSLTGVKVGDKIVFNPKKAYDNNEAEVASLLQTTKDNIKDVNSDFEFEVKEITRYQEAEMNQELFDKVLGPGVVNSEEEFAEKVAESLNNQFKPDSDNLFMREVRKLFLEKLKDVQLPDAFLKRWLWASNEKKTQESVEEEYPQMMEDLKFLLAKNKIVKRLNIEIKSEDVQAKAEEVAKAQFAQYGMSNLPAETLKSYVNSMLSNENTVRNIIQNIEDEKVIDWVKQTVKVIDKEISTKELNELFTAEEEHNHSEEEHHHDHSSETETETEKEA